MGRVVPSGSAESDDSDGCAEGGSGRVTHVRPAVGEERLQVDVVPGVMRVRATGTAQHSDLNMLDGSTIRSTLFT